MIQTHVVTALLAFVTLVIAVAEFGRLVPVVSSGTVRSHGWTVLLRFLPCHLVPRMLVNVVVFTDAEPKPGKEKRVPAVFRPEIVFSTLATVVPMIVHFAPIFARF